MTDFIQYLKTVLCKLLIEEKRTERLFFINVFYSGNNPTYSVLKARRK